MNETAAKPSQKYWAFISYSHRDKTWADWLHHAIETYQVPARLVGRSSRGDPIPTRLFPVFRDRDELPTSGDLDANIKEALRGSRYLIVICSPHAAASRWVDQEIRTFKALSRENRVLCLIVGGEPNASDKTTAGADECFPESLRYKAGPDGRLTSERTEPIAADARQGRDGKDNARLKLLAGLLDVGFDELRQRDLERRRRARALWAAGALAGLALLAGTWGWQERAKNRGLSRQLALAYAEKAQRLAQDGDDAEAALYYLESYRLSPSHLALVNARSLSAGLSVPEVLLKGSWMAAAFSVDGSSVVGLRDHGTFDVWQAGTGLSYGEPVQTGTTIYALAFSPDGSRIAAGGEDGTARLWNADSRARVGPEFRHTGAVTALAFSPDGMRLLTASADHTARLWDLASGKPSCAPMRHGDVVYCAVFSKDGRRLMTGSEDQQVRVWDARTCAPIGKPLKQGAPVRSVAFSPDGRRGLSGSADTNLNGVARLWDLGSGRQILQVRHAGRIEQAVFAPDGRTFMTGSKDRTVHFWDAATGRSLGAPVPQGAWVLDTAFSPDGRRIMTVTNEGPTRIWRNPLTRPAERELRHRGPITALTVSSDGLRLATGSGDRKARIWDLARLDEAPRVLPHEDEVNFVEFSPDDARLLSFGDKDGIGRLWETATGRPIGGPVLMGSVAGVTGSGLLSRDGRLIASHSQKSVRLWDGRTGTSVALLTADADVRVVYFSPDGTKLLADTGKGLTVWDLATRSKVTDVRFDGEINCSGFTPDGTLLLVAFGTTVGGKIRILDGRTYADTGMVLDPEGDVGFLDFRKDGGVMSAALWQDRSVRLWDTKTWKRLGTVIRHANHIVEVSFHPDGKTLLTASWDGTARLWDIRTGEPIGKPMRHQGAVNGAVFVRGGRAVATASAGTVVRLWDTAWLTEGPAVKELSLAAQVVSRHRIGRNGDLETILREAWTDLAGRLIKERRSPAKLPGSLEEP